MHLRPPLLNLTTRETAISCSLITLINRDLSVSIVCRRTNLSQVNALRNEVERHRPIRLH